MTMSSTQCTFNVHYMFWNWHLVYITMHINIQCLQHYVHYFNTMYIQCTLPCTLLMYTVMYIWQRINCTFHALVYVTSNAVPIVHCVVHFCPFLCTSLYITMHIARTNICVQDLLTMYIINDRDVWYMHDKNTKACTFLALKNVFRMYIKFFIFLYKCRHACTFDVAIICLQCTCWSTLKCPL